MDHASLQRTLARNAALLMVLGLATGVGVSAAMTGKVAADPHAMLASHLNALLGGLWMVAVAWTLPMLRYGEVGARRLVWLVTVANFANWAVTIWKAAWRVAGVDFVGEGRNDTIFVVLTLTVVVPALASAGAWLWGFGGRRS